MYWRGEEQRRPLTSNSTARLTEHALKYEHIYCFAGQEIDLAIFLTHYNCNKTY